MESDPKSVTAFHAGLSATLAQLLDAAHDAESLWQGLEFSVAAAEQLCCERPLACGPGCPHCCVLNVAVLLPEAMRIADWLETHLPTRDLANLIERLTSHRSWERWMDDEERIMRQATCPFLDGDGRCFIHPVRPLTCRGVASLDRRRCAEAFRPTLDEREEAVPADLWRRAIYDAVFTAFGDTLEQQGLQGRSIELGSGVLGFLAAPELRRDYLSGQELPRWLWG